MMNKISKTNPSAVSGFFYDAFFGFYFGGYFYGAYPSDPDRA